jgi:hypothetical protein
LLEVLRDASFLQEPKLWLKVPRKGCDKPDLSFTKPVLRFYAYSMQQKHAVAVHDSRSSINIVLPDFFFVQACHPVRPTFRVSHV